MHNMVRQLVGGENIVWEDAEMLIEHYGCQAIFGRNTLPSDWNSIADAFNAATLQANQTSFLKPSVLRETLYNHLCNGTSEDIRNIQQIIYHHLEKRSKEEERILSERANTKKEQSAEEQTGDLCLPKTAPSTTTTDIRAGVYLRISASEAGLVGPDHGGL
jgi:hypothetical protein